MKSPHDRVTSVVNAASPVWVARMGLSHWEIEHVFIDAQLIEEPISDDYLITATTETRWNYLQAKIKWYLPSAVRLSDEILEHTLVHELCHVVLAPEQSLLDIKLEQIAADETGDNSNAVMKLMFERMELATEQMTRCILQTYRTRGTT